MSSDIFTPASKTIRKVFGDADSFYNVPDYQRPYQWDDERVDQLWDDLYSAFIASEDTVNGTEAYFLGSIILIRNDDSFDIVDGQQRLTTLTILFSVVRDLFPNLDPMTLKIIKNSVRDLVGEKQRLRFTTGIDRQNEFEQTIVNQVQFPKKFSNADKKKFPYLNTALIFKERLALLAQDEVIQFINFIFDNVRLITIQCENRSFAIKLFQVLNARGLDLTAADLIKSFLMNKLPEKFQTQFIATWRQVENTARDLNEPLDTLLTYYLYYLKGANPERGLYDELALQLRDRDANEVVYEFQKFIGAYKDILSMQDKYIYTLRYLRHEMYWKTALAAAKFLGRGDISRIARALRNFYYAHWIAEYSSTKIKQPSFNILQMLKENSSAEDIEGFLDSAASKNNVQSRCKQSLCGEVYKERWLKPLLLATEYALVDRVLGFIELEKDLHVEHVLPVKYQNIPYWQRLYSREQADSVLDSIANLTLISGKKNIAASNSAFADKIHIYDAHKDSALTAFRLSQWIRDRYSSGKQDWDKAALEERLKWILGIISGELSLKVGDISFEHLGADALEGRPIKDDSKIGRDATPVNFNNDCMSRVNAKLKRSFWRKSQSLFIDETNGAIAVCRVSKEHTDGVPNYWYRFDPDNRDILTSDPINNLAVFGCGSEEQVLIFRGDELIAHLPNLNVTDREDDFYWHVQFEKVEQRFFLRLRAGGRVEVTKFLLIDQEGR